MKLLRFGDAGHERPGLLDATGVIRDLSGVVADITGLTIDDASLARIASIDPQSLPTVDAAVRMGPCVGAVSKFICVGLNYADHAAESNLPIPQEPILFQKAVSAICGPNDDVIRPKTATKMDWEVELGIVIGQRARNITEGQAEAHIAGYCVVNDVSERAYQAERGGQWTKGKSADTFGPIGPWLVTRDEIADIQSLALFLDVDGIRRQTGNTATMIFSVYHLVAYISEFMTLEPGDIIATGTPPGVGMGMKPPVYLEAGQTMHLGIAGLGEQRQTVVAYR
jgi:2-keto-4-pentenoate hydratase/2-oxohepta-3-ene-1,7-dioic acid hydratase in catechol pathway